MYRYTYFVDYIVDTTFKDEKKKNQDNFKNV